MNVHDKFDTKPIPQFKMSGMLCPACKSFFSRSKDSYDRDGYDRHWEDVLRTRRLKETAEQAGKKTN